MARRMTKGQQALHKQALEFLKAQAPVLSPVEWHLPTGGVSKFIPLLDMVHGVDCIVTRVSQDVERKLCIMGYRKGNPNQTKINPMDISADDLISIAGALQKTKYSTPSA